MTSSLKTPSQRIAKARAAIARVKAKDMATIDDYLAVESGFLALDRKPKHRKPKWPHGDPYSPKGDCL